MNKLMTQILKLPQGKWMYYRESLFFLGDLRCCHHKHRLNLNYFLARAQPRKVFIIKIVSWLIIPYVPRHILIPFCLLHTTSNDAYPASPGKPVDCCGTCPKYHQNLTLCCELLSMNYFFASRPNLHLNQCNELFWDVEREAFI